jgi:hypothetical protein
LAFKKHGKAIAVFLVVVIAAALVLNHGLMLAPPFEGLTAGGVGVTLSDSSPSGYFTVSQSLPSPYYWNNNNHYTQTNDMVLYHAATLWGLGPGRGEVEITSQEQPQQLQGGDSFSTPKTVDYWTKDGSGNWVEVKGQINVYMWHIDFTSRDTGDLGSQNYFTNVAVWFGFVGNTWNNAYQTSGDTTGSPVYVQAWEAPLFAVISSYDPNCGGASNCQISPAQQGAPLDLVTSPNSGSSVDDLGLSSGNNPNTTLVNGGNPLAPDTGLSDHVYFELTMVSFGASGSSLGQVFPAVGYDIKVYTIQLGKYTYTNPDDTPWSHTNSTCSGIACWPGIIGGLIGSLLNNPFTWVIIAVVVVVIIAIFAPEVFLLAGSRRKKNQ